ncbi:MAG: hypothetical protein C0424_01580 [Sphingobacteriaceae bacterium]|nr:hypothetical protein [Sphingobacteriaceae bacterium]
MNKEFQVKALFLATNRKRNITISAKDESDVKEKLHTMGYIEPFEIQELPPEPPTEAQLNYANNLKIQVPSDATKEDLSALIQKSLDHDSDPNPDLIEFANEMGLHFSKFIGKKSLYSFIFHNLELKDKIAFFVFSIYRWLSDDRKGNLSKHQHKEVFYEFANQQLSNNQFLKSMTKYSGSELRFFGLIKFDDGGESYGGSENTIAYKTCAEFLNHKFGVKKSKTITLKSNGSNQLGKMLKPDEVKSGCLSGTAILVVIIVSSIIILGQLIA